MDTHTNEINAATLETLLRHTNNGKFKNDLVLIFTQYYQQFPEKYFQRFNSIINQNNKNNLNNTNSNNDENATAINSTNSENNSIKINLPDIQKITETLESSLVLPLIANDLLATINDDSNVDTKQLAKFIAQEQPIAIRVLRVANSPFYGLSRQVDSLESAIMVLGFRTIRTLILSVAIIGALQPPTCELFDCQDFWKHSLIVALTSRQLAKLLACSPELAFTAGLLHDIGKLALAGCFQQEYNQALKYQSENDCSLLSAENTVLNITHPQIGEILAKNWRLPESLSSVIHFHHTPSQLFQLQRNQHQQTNTNLLQLCDIVHLANVIAPLLRLSESHEQENYSSNFGDVVSTLDETTWLRLCSKLKFLDILNLLPKIEQDFKEISQTLLG